MFARVAICIELEVWPNLLAVMDIIIIAYDLMGIHSRHDYNQSCAERCKQLLAIVFDFVKPRKLFCSLISQIGL